MAYEIDPTTLPKEDNIYPPDYGFYYNNVDGGYTIPLDTRMELFLHLVGFNTSGGIRAALYQPKGEYVKNWWGKTTWKPYKIYLHQSIKTEQDLISLYGVLTGRLLTKKQPYDTRQSNAV